ncbi:MAG: hypothetical protein V1787_01910 [Candidatus Micrarchaeota archaeon]
MKYKTREQAVHHAAAAWIWVVVLAFLATNFLANPKYVSVLCKLLGI